MLLPSVENTGTSSTARQKKSVSSELPSTTQQVAQENQIRETPQHQKVEKANDQDQAAQQSNQQKKLQELPNSTFSTDTIDSSYPDFTVDFNSSNSAVAPAIAELKPDEIRYGRKRPPLPIIFSFGLRRPQAVAVAMRHPLLEGQQPSTAAQAILDTLDLAATNRLPYIKGTEISLVA